MPPAHFEDVSRWPVSRYFRGVVAEQPDGRVLIFFGKINIVVGILVLLWLWFAPISSNLTWVHVVLFLGLPLVGFVMFVRDKPSPWLTEYVPVILQPWERVISVISQLFVALFPWFVILKSHVYWLVDLIDFIKQLVL